VGVVAMPWRALPAGAAAIFLDEALVVGIVQVGLRLCEV
jgi:hypothetical protein